MFGLIYHEPLQYNDYSYPNWAEWVGWSLALSSIIMIPIVAIIQLVNTPGTLKEVSKWELNDDYLQNTYVCFRESQLI